MFLSRTILWEICLLLNYTFYMLHDFKRMMIFTFVYIGHGKFTFHSRKLNFFHSQLSFLHGILYLFRTNPSFIHGNPNFLLCHTHSFNTVISFIHISFRARCTAIQFSHITSLGIFLLYCPLSKWRFLICFNGNNCP